MRVHVPRKTLADSLGHVERIIPSRSSNPALSLVRLSLTEDSLTLSGSNMEIDIEVTLPADVQQQGEYALPAQLFSQIVRALPGEMVELGFKDTELDIASGNYATRLQLAEASGVAPLAFPDTYGGALSAEGLARALEHVRYAAAVAEYQAIFRGVKLELSDARSRAVATDGFRLAYYTLPQPSGLGSDLVLPARSVDELIKLLGDGEVELALEGGQLSLATGRARVNIKLMEGAFPDYERVIPKQFPISVTLGARALAEAVSRVAVMADKTANNRVDVFVKDGTMQITAEGSYGRSQEALEVMQEGSDPEIALAYNAKYLTDALGPLAGDLQLRFSGTVTPSVLVSLDDANYLAMIVPLRTA
jgi:DNA polymerase III subunit beta